VLFVKKIEELKGSKERFCAEVERVRADRIEAANRAQRARFEG